MLKSRRLRLTFYHWIMKSSNNWDCDGDTPFIGLLLEKVGRHLHLDSGLRIFVVVGSIFYLIDLQLKESHYGVVNTAKSKIFIGKLG